MKKRKLKNWVVNTCLGVVALTFFWIPSTIEGLVNNFNWYEMAFDTMLIILSIASIYLINNFSNLLED